MVVGDIDIDMDIVKIASKWILAIYSNWQTYKFVK